LVVLAAVGAAPRPMRTTPREPEGLVKCAVANSSPKATDTRCAKVIAAAACSGTEELAPCSA
jgi:hypothetical protein